MVAVVGGSGFGLFNTSLNTLGGAGVIGQGRQGQYGGMAYVNAANGNLVLQALDEQLSGRGFDLNHLRTYNVQGVMDDGDGDGWRWDGERRIAVNGNYGAADSTVVRTGGDGNQTIYRWNAAKQKYQSTDGGGAHDTVAKDAASGEWTWTDGTSRMTERYGASGGRLQAQVDASGNRIDYKYEGPGERLSEVIDAGSGQRLLLSYVTVAGTSHIRLSKVETRALVVDSANRVTAALGAAVRQVEYGYDSLGRLTSVKTDLTPDNTTDSKFYVTGYTYDGDSFRVASILQGDGTAPGTAYAHFTYEQIGTTGVYRVRSVTDAGGTQTFNYSVPGQTRITDAAGREWHYVYDGKSRLVEIRSPASTAGANAVRTIFTYDDADNVKTVTDSLGNTTTYGYDANGNRTLERDALGNTLTRLFNDKNQMVVETRYRTPDPDGEGSGEPGAPESVRYVYDDNARLRFVVTAEGRVSENRYDAGGYGHLERTIRYIDARFAVGAAPLDEAAMNGWLGGLTAAQKSSVRLSAFSYDYRGNLSKQTDFAKVDAQGSGVLDATADVIEYVYDGHGQLLQRIAVRGSGRDQRSILASVLYDGMGRELTTVNVSGTRTTVYNDKTGSIVITTSAGLTITQTHDARGRLVGVVRMDGSQMRGTKYFYDATGRLRMTETSGPNPNDIADDVRQYNFYDNAGRLQYLVDGAGSVSEMAYDANGKVVRQVQFSNKATTTGWFDPATGQVVKNSLTFGGVGSDVVLDPAHDRKTEYSYDPAGRLKTTTDAANVVTTTTYDGVSRIERTQTGDRITRYIYDRDGLQVGVVDALGYLTEKKFDGAGRLVETLRYHSPGARDNASDLVWLGVTNRTVESDRTFEHRLPAAFDPDGDRLTYSVVGTLPSWLSFDAEGLVLKGKAPAAAGTHSIVLKVSDNHPTSPKTATVTVQITVGNSAPAWSDISDRVVAVNATGFTVTLPVATDTHSSAPQLVYSIDQSLIPPGMSFIAGERKLTGVPTMAGRYVITARVTDPHGGFTERTFVVSVTNSGPSWGGIAPGTVPDGRVNTPYSFFVPVATDPEGQVLSYQEIALPPGLSFNRTTREITGRPTAPGAHSVVLVAKDPSGEEVRTAFTITVKNSSPYGNNWGNPDLGIPAPIRYLGTYSAGSHISESTPPPMDPEGEPLSFMLIGALPPGLVFNAATGTVSGRPMSVGDFTWQVRVSDPHGASIVQTVHLRLLNVAPVYVGNLNTYVDLSESNIVDIDVGAHFYDPNGDSLSFSYTGRPTWLHVSADGRQLIGTAPGGGNKSISVTVTDSRGASIVVTFTLYIASGGGTSPFSVSEAGPARAGLGATSTATDPGAVQALEDLDPLAGLRPTNLSADRSRIYYDGQGRVAWTVDERGFLTETVYDAHDNTQKSIRYLNPLVVGADDTLESLRQRAGESRISTIAYDGFGRVSTRTDVDGSVSRDVYDASGRLVRKITAEGHADQRAQRIRYNAFDEVTGTLGGVGDATLAAEATQGQIDAAIASYGMRYEFDVAGRRVKAVDANGKATFFYYDREDRLTHTVNAAGEVSETNYNSYGQIESTRRYDKVLTTAQLATLAGGLAEGAFRQMLVPNANKDETVSYEYDRRGLLTHQKDGVGNIVKSTYTDHGQLETQTHTITTGRESVTRYGYSLRGDLLLRTGDIGGLNQNSRTHYDAFGRVLETIDGSGKATTYRYDHGGRIVVTKAPLERVTQVEYDAFGRAWKTTDASGKTTSYTYDEAGRSMTVKTPEGVEVVTRRNRHGEIHEVIDGRGGKTTYSYDKNGMLKSVKDANERLVTQNGYDNSGRLKETVDATGIKTTIGYDAVNRIIERIVDPTGLNLRTTYAFNGVGRQIRVTEGAGTSSALITDYEYDRNGRLIASIVDPDGLKLRTGYSFDGAGNTIRVERGTVSDSSQQVTRYEFDNLGRRVRTVVELREQLANGQVSVRDLATEYRYDTAGRVSRTIDAMGHSTWFVYDAAGRQVQTINALGEVVQTQYDANDRVVQVRRWLATTAVAAFGDVIGIVPPSTNGSDQRVANVYDADGRLRFTLQAAVGGNWTITENIPDANGNIIERRRYDKYLIEDRFSTIESGGISAAEVASELEELGYGAESTLRYIQRTRYAYDASNRLRFVVDALGSVSETVYDDAGRVTARIAYETRPTLTTFSESVISGAVNRTNDLNQVSRFTYDTAGRLRYSIKVLASVGGVATQHLVRRQETDALGRVVMDVAYTTPVGSLSSYTSAAIDLKVVVSNNDRRSAKVFDNAGREIYSVVVSGYDADGVIRHSVVARSYDALGQIVRQTAYATEVGALAGYTREAIEAAIVPSSQDRSTEMVYDSAGRQRFVIAADGGLSETIYDGNGRPKETRQYAFLVDKSISWTEASLAARRGGRHVGDGVTRGEKISYNAIGQVVGKTDALGKSESWSYNALGNAISYTNKNGNTWDYIFDRVGRLVRQIEPQAMVQLSNQATPSLQRMTTLIEHDVFGNVTKRHEAFNTVDARVTSYEYDRVGRQFKVTEPGWYDPNTGAVWKTSAAGRYQRTTEVTYDALGHAVRNKVRIGVNAFSYSYQTYDALGRLSHQVNELNQVTAFTYTAFGEQKSVSRHSIPMAGTLPASGYWSAADVAAKIASDTLTRTTTTSYDQQGRRLEIVGPEAGYYFSATNPITNPSGAPVTASARTRFKYNAFGEIHRQETQIDTTRWMGSWHYYDTVGRETLTVTDYGQPGAEGDEPSGYHTARRYDAVGNLVEVIEYASSGEGGLPHDDGEDGDGDRPSSLIPPRNPWPSSGDRITGFVYDARNQRIAVQRFGLTYSVKSGTGHAQISNARDVGTTVQTLTYDGVGKVLTDTDALGNTTTYLYGATGHVVKVIEPTRTVAGSGADPFRNQQTSSPITTFTHDAFGRVLKQVREVATASAVQVRTMIQQFDVAGNVTTRIDAAGNERYYTYDHAGRVLSEAQNLLIDVGDWAPSTSSLYRTYTYDLLGRQTEVLDHYTDAAGAAKKSGQRNKFDVFGDMVETGHISGNSLSASSALAYVKVAEYGYNRAGLRISQRAADGETRFFYNLAGLVSRTEQRGNNSTADGTVTRVTETGYDIMGRAVFQRLPMFSALYPYGTDRNRTELVTPITTQSYDRWGNVTRREQGSYIDHTGQWNSGQKTYAEYLYNADNQLIEERLPTVSATRSDGSTYSVNVTHEIRYDIAGRAVQELDWADDYNTGPVEKVELRKRTREYDEIGQLVAENDATDVTDVTSSQRRGIRTEYAYDAHGNRVGTRNALGTVFLDAYDNNGNMLSRSILRQALSNGTTVAYDSRNAGHVGTAVKLIEHRYDQANRRYATAEFADGYGAWTFTIHDGRNQVVSVRNPSGITTTHEYDQHGNRTKTTAGNGSFQTWAYSYADFQAGRLLSSTVGNQQTTYEYNDFGLVKKETYSGQAGSRTYTYHANGLVRSIVDVYSEGVRGNEGGADYFSATDTVEYEYSATGQRQKESFSRTGEEDYKVFNYEERRWEVKQRSLADPARVTRTTYDDQGRVATVTASAGPGSAQLNSVTYQYDELGNRRRVQAQYVRAGGSAAGSDHWYTYDREGRMTGSELAAPGQDSRYGTYVHYDALGRRSQATDQWRNRSGGIPPGGGTPYVYRDQVVHKYQYNDLGHVTVITEKVIREGEDGDSPETMVLQQTHDDRGRLRSQTTFEQGVRKTFTENTYHNDGRLFDRRVTAYKNLGRDVDAAASSFSNSYQYDGSGNLKSYVRHHGEGTSDYYSNTYTYNYQMEFGGERESSITVTSTADNARSSATQSDYDSRGRLIKQSVEEGERSIRKTFSYDGEGNIITKKESRSGGDLPAASGRLDNFFGNGQEIAAIGSGDLVTLTRISNGYTAISDAYPAAVPGSYTVNTGDTLAGIARKVFGDSQLWYLIADANNLSYGPGDSLPTVEEGKTYRIPNVATDRNHADTFRPYNAAEVIGDTTPTPSIRPEQCMSNEMALLANTVAVAISVAIQVTTTAALSAVGVPAPIAGAVGGAAGSASGNAMNQGIAIAQGQQDSWEWDQWGQAVGQGAVSGLVSSGVPQGQGVAARSFTQVWAQNFGNLAGRAIAGGNVQFSWSQFGASAASTVLGNTLDNLPSGRPDVMSWGTNDHLRGAVTTGASTGLQSLFGEKVSFAAAASNYVGGIAGDYFGNELAQSIREAMAPPPAAPKGVVQEMGGQTFAGDRHEEVAPIEKTENILETIGKGAGEAPEDADAAASEGYGLQLRSEFGDADPMAIMNEVRVKEMVRRGSLAAAREAAAMDDPVFDVVTQESNPRLWTPSKPESSVPYADLNSGADMAGGVLNLVKRGLGRSLAGSLEDLASMQANNLRRYHQPKIAQYMRWAEQAIQAADSEPGKALDHLAEAQSKLNVAKMLQNKVLRELADYARRGQEITNTYAKAFSVVRKISKASGILGVVTDVGGRVLGDQSPTTRTEYKVADGSVAAWIGATFGERFPLLTALDAAQGLFTDEKPVPVTDTIKGGWSILLAVGESIEYDDATAITNAHRMSKAGEFGRFFKVAAEYGEFHAHVGGGIERTHRVGSYLKRAGAPQWLEYTGAFMAGMPGVGQVGIAVGKPVVRFVRHLRTNVPGDTQMPPPNLKEKLRLPPAVLPDWNKQDWSHPMIRPVTIGR
ncbi:putative Ig domain-containing protein [Arenimonas terrae]|uniref:LysM domain-containing protein n=1 Tax=Arenimonas terrae TaxID=2546226 RepID=A0A5C4RPN9_9GAMM|nr:putative Ig domain-containing protein [Arenimonas terrae]TNJ33223.1 hypothetical protein E1B00_13065 [Arenimonas terrae]